MNLTRPESRFERLGPLAGIVGGLLWAANLILTGGQPQITDGGPQGYVHWFAGHQAQSVLGAATVAYFCVMMLLFAVAVHRALRPGTPAHAAAAFAGGIGLALSTGLVAMISAAEADASSQHNAAALTSIGFLDGDTWLLTSATMAAFFLATGLGALHARALPRAWAIITIVLGVVCLVPLGGIGAYFVTPVWLIVTGTMLYRRQATAATAATPAPQPQSSLA